MTSGWTQIIMIKTSTRIGSHTRMLWSNSNSLDMMLPLQNSIASKKRMRSVLNQTRLVILMMMSTNSRWTPLPALYQKQSCSFLWPLRSICSIEVIRELCIWTISREQTKKGPQLEKLSKGLSSWKILLKMKKKVRRRFLPELETSKLLETVPMNKNKWKKRITKEWSSRN